jgi:hypothetical protein
VPPQEEHSWGQTVDFSKRYIPTPADQHPPTFRHEPRPAMIDLVIRSSRGQVKDETQAIYILAWISQHMPPRLKSEPTKSVLLLDDDESCSISTS